MLYEYHNEGKLCFLYTCDKCKKNVEDTWYHCTVCEDFDLCASCHETENHPHNMEDGSFKVHDGSAACDTAQSNLQETRFRAIQLCLQYLTHACQCHDGSCFPGCMKTKRVLEYARRCEPETHGSDPIMKQFIALCCYHAKHCQEGNCPVPFCADFKCKLVQQRLQQHQNLRRKIASGMSNAIGNPVAPMDPPQGLSNPGPEPSFSTVHQGVQQLRKILNSPVTRQKWQQVLSVFKLNPCLMAAVIKQRKAQQQQQGQFSSPQPPMYAQRQSVSIPMAFSHQQGEGAPPSNQMSSPTHPQGQVPSSSQQQLIQQVRSPPPTAAQLAQVVRSPQPTPSSH